MTEKQASREKKKKTTHTALLSKLGPHFFKENIEKETFPSQRGTNTAGERGRTKEGSKSPEGTGFPETIHTEKKIKDGLVTS